MTKIEYTHKAWFGFCPIYMTKKSDDGAEITPRFRYTDWLIPLSASVFGALFKMAQMVKPDFEPRWAFAGMTELDKPVVVEY